jgi:hypothetical protein
MVLITVIAIVNYDRETFIVQPQASKSSPGKTTIFSYNKVKKSLIILTKSVKAIQLAFFITDSEAKTLECLSLTKLSTYSNI